MIDILPYIAQLLEPTGAQIELSFNDVSATLPLIVLSEISNIASVITEGEERISDVTVQLDIYAETEEHVRSSAVCASRILTAAGFRRSSATPQSEDGLKRLTLDFTAKIDSGMGIIYPGANY